MIKYPERKCETCEFPVRDNNLRLVSAFGRSHSREVHRITRPPVFLLQIPEVPGHHDSIGTPVFKTQQHPESYLVDSGLSHAVISVKAPVIMWFHPSRVIFLICLPMVRFLKTYHSIETAVGQTLIFRRTQRLHLKSQIVKIGSARAENIFHIFDSA